MIEVTPQLLLLCGAGAMVAGFVDTLAGGGGLITVPLLLLAGVPPLETLAINKTQSLCGSSTAASMMVRHGLVRVREHGASVVLAFCGAAGGAIFVQHLDTRMLDFVIPIVLAGICAYVIFSPQAGAVRSTARMSARTFRLTILPLIGAYDGVFGPGTGSFLALSGVALRGDTLLEATAKAKLYNFATNVAAAGVFIAGGHVLWPIAAAMGCGQILGAIFGAKVIARGSTKFIKPLIVTVSILMTLRYAWQHLVH